MTISSKETDLQNQKRQPQQTAKNSLEADVKCTDRIPLTRCKSNTASSVSKRPVPKLKPDSIRYLQRSIHTYICQAMRLDKQKNKLLQQAEYLSSKLHERM